MVFVSGLTLQNSPLAQWKGNPIGPLGGEPIIKNRCFLEWETNHPKRGGFNKRKISGLRTPSLINNKPLAVLVSNAPSDWRKQTDIVVSWRAQMRDWFAFIYTEESFVNIPWYSHAMPCFLSKMSIIVFVDVQQGIPTAPKRSLLTTSWLIRIPHPWIVIAPN